MKPKISVAMATYNGEKHIVEQLVSIAKQAVIPYEIVVCDDGSADATLSLVKEFAASAPFPVRIYRNETRLGYSINFLKAAGLCQGDWIAFSDQDDVWLPNKLARVSEAIEGCPDNELVLVVHNSLIANSNLEPSGQRLFDLKRDCVVERGQKYAFSLMHGFCIICSSKLVKDMHPTLCSPPDLLGHDGWVCLLAYAVGSTLQISEPLVIWRRHDKAVSRAPKPKNLLGDTKIAISMLDPQHYFSTGTLARKCAASFREISETVCQNDLKDNIVVGEGWLFKLSKNLFLRGNLYKAKNPVEKMKVAGEMLIKNAYFGRRFYSLGWRSLLKDMAFAFGIVG